MKRHYIFSFLVLLFIAFSCSKSDDVIDDDATIPPEEPEEVIEYEQGNASDIEKDEQITPSDAKANQANSDNEGIDKTLDGNKDEDHIYHSPWGDATEFPVILEYFFEEVEVIDYFVLYPRGDQPNGRFGKTTIYTKTTEDSEYVKLDDYDFEESASPRIIKFPDGLKNPSGIKIEVNSGANDFASLAEIEFYKNSGSIDDYMEIFEDKAATQLKSELSREDLEDIDNDFVKKMAIAIYEDVYDDFRIGEFKSYPDPGIIAAENKTNTYGFYDNATGIYVKWGTEMVVFMDDFEGNISLRVVDHTSGFEGNDYLLKPGANRFTVNTEGLAYLIYQDNNQEHEVKANFATGKINGYFDVAKHTKADWDKLIDKAPYRYFDILGEKTMLSFTTDDLKNSTDDIEELIGLYDDMVKMEQEFMGLHKYDRVPQTRAYFRTNTHDPNMYMYSTGYRTEYNVNTMSAIANPTTFKSSPWGPAHEVGHTHQTRPGIMWLGLTEVTTNIYAQFVQTEWGNPARLDEEDMGDYNNRYEKGFTENLYKHSHPAIEDVFVKLIPFWQLKLYFDDVLGDDDFYKDLHEYVRTHDDPPTSGEQQVNFVKIASEVAQLDLSDFFKSWGFLTEGSWDLDDYGQGNITVTQSMIDEVIDYVSQYPKPEAKIEYLHEQSVDAYRNRASATPGDASVSGNDVSISGSTNIAAFEVERNGELIFISTRANFSVGDLQSSDKIYAVSYDGERKEVN